MASRLLIDEPPLQVLPSLAVAIGLNEAMLLQQVHYWLQRTKHYHDGRPWIYNTYDEWQEQFPFWSVKTVRNIIGSLEKSELLLSGHFSEHATDRTKWYSVNYEKLDEIASALPGKSKWQDLPDGSGKVRQMQQATPAGSSTEINDQENNQETEEKFLKRMKLKYGVSDRDLDDLVKRHTVDGELRRAAMWGALAMRKAPR